MFIYGCSYMDAHIWNNTYDQSYERYHIWRNTYGCSYMVVHIWLPRWSIYERVKFRIFHIIFMLIYGWSYMVSVYDCDHIWLTIYDRDHIWLTIYEWPHIGHLVWTGKSSYTGACQKPYMIDHIWLRPIIIYDRIWSYTGIIYGISGDRQWSLDRIWWPYMNITVYDLIYEHLFLWDEG